MAACGIPLALASDNCRDPFYGYGDHDLVEYSARAGALPISTAPSAPGPPP
jgi:cytosine/creatinine deaminase